MSCSDEEECSCQTNKCTKSKTLKVINNERFGMEMRLCQEAIDDNPEIFPCNLCGKWMLGEFFVLDDEFEICAKCFDETPSLIDVVKKVLDTNCKWFLLFPKCDYNLKEKEKPDRGFCNLCNTTHILEDPDEFCESNVDEYDMLQHVNYAIFNKNQSVLSPEAKVLLDEILRLFKVECENFMIEKKRKKSEKHAKRVALEKKCADTRKRLLRALVPVFNRLSDKSLDRHFSPKRSRIYTKEECATAERMIELGPNEMSQEEVKTFAAFLAE